MSSYRMRTIILTIACGISVAPCARSAGAEPASDPAPLFTTEECQSHPWIIGFEQNRWQLNEFAQHRLDDFAHVFAADPGPILISGRIDWPETADRDLARKRIEVVAAELARRGIPARAVWTRDDGSTDPIVANAHAEPDAQNRIILITLPSEGESCARHLARARALWLHRHCSNLSPGHDASCDAVWSALGQN